MKLAHLVLPALAASVGLASAAVQDFRQLAPAQLNPGPIVLQCEIYSGAVDDRWIEFHAFSQRGWFICRMTRLSSEASRPPSVLPTPKPAAFRSSREIAWDQVNQESLRVYGGTFLWLEGNITSVSAGGNVFQGIFAFKNEGLRLRLEMLEDVVYDSNPAPTLSDIAFGQHPKQVMDVYLTTRRRPAPVAVFLHGGAWVHFDKTEIRNYPYHEFLDAGISVVSVDYRFLPAANPDAATPAVAVPLRDAARGVQFVRSRAKEWGINPERLGLWGESAGACSALWLGTHPDLAVPAASGEIERESTRPWCVAAVNPQTSLDPAQMRAWIGPHLTYGPRAFGIQLPGGPTANFEAFLAARKKLLPLIDEYSPAAQLDRNGPPLYLAYPHIPLAPAKPPDYVHSPRFGIGFYQIARQVGRECYLSYEGRKEDRYHDWLAFMIAKLEQ